MLSLKPFLLLFCFCLFLVPAQAVPVQFSDINLQDRSVSIYLVNASGTFLISSPDMVTSNASIDLDPTGSYQIVIEPDKNTWFDDPLNAVRFFTSDNMGQTITFLMFAFTFIGIVRLGFR